MTFSLFANISFLEKIIVPAMSPIYIQDTVTEPCKAIDEWLKDITQYMVEVFVNWNSCKVTESILTPHTELKPFAQSKLLCLLMVCGVLSFGVMLCFLMVWCCVFLWCDVVFSYGVLLCCPLVWCCVSYGVLLCFLWCAFVFLMVWCCVSYGVLLCFLWCAVVFSYSVMLCF